MVRRHDELRKVCSIWICTDPPKDLANTIECYTLDQHVILGNCPPHRVDKIRLVLVRLSCDEDKNNTMDDDRLGIIPLLNVCLAKTVNKDRQDKVTQRYHVQLDSEDRDMTAGEQIIYKHHREMWELGEQIKELGEQNKELGEQNKELGEQNKELGEQIKLFGEQNKELGKQNKELGEQNKELGEQNKELGEQNKELREKAQKDKEVTARILKNAHVAVDIIAKSTGLSLEQIEAL